MQSRILELLLIPKVARTQKQVSAADNRENLLNYSLPCRSKPVEPAPAPGSARLRSAGSPSRC